MHTMSASGWYRPLTVRAPEDRRTLADLLLPMSGRFPYSRTGVCRSREDRRYYFSVKGVQKCVHFPDDLSFVLRYT